MRKKNVAVSQILTKSDRSAAASSSPFNKTKRNNFVDRSLNEEFPHAEKSVKPFDFNIDAKLETRQTFDQLFHQRKLDELLENCVVRQVRQRFAELSRQAPAKRKFDEIVGRTLFASKHFGKLWFFSENFLSFSEAFRVDQIRGEFLFKQRFVSVRIEVDQLLEEDFVADRNSEREKKRFLSDRFECCFVRLDFSLGENEEGKPESLSVPLHWVDFENERKFSAEVDRRDPEFVEDRKLNKTNIDSNNEKTIDRPKLRRVSSRFCF